jgi:hypothetical protein
MKLTRLLLAPVVSVCTTTAATTAAATPALAVGTLDLPSLDAQLAALAWQGLLNRVAPTLYLRNPAFDALDGHGLPELDSTWLDHLRSRKGYRLWDVNGSSLCELLRLQPTDSDASPAHNVPLVVHDAVGGGEPEPGRFGAGADIDASRFAALSLASSIAGLPVSVSLLRRGADGDPRFSCLQHHRVVANFSGGVFMSEQAAYGFVTRLVTAGNLSRTLFVSALDTNSTMAGGWMDPSSFTATDLAFRERSAVIGLSPSPTVPDQRALFNSFLDGLRPRATLVGWAWSENDMCASLSRTGSRVIDGAPNLSLWRAVPTNGTASLPASRRVRKLDRNKVYITFQSGAGDTATNAIALQNGMWPQSGRGSVPMAWGCDPLVGHLFPAIFEYYAMTATVNDTFFAETAGAGYAWPFHFPESGAATGGFAPTLEGFYKEAGQLMQAHGPASGLLDLWEDDNHSKIARAVAASDGRIKAITRPPMPADTPGVGLGAASGASNGWIRLLDGTKLPYIASARPLWYSQLNGSSEPGSRAGFDDLYARIVGAAAALPHVRPLFLSVQSLGFNAEPDPPSGRGTWGGLLAAAIAMSVRLGPQFELIGADDMVALAIQAVQLND